MSEYTLEIKQIVDYRDPHEGNGGGFPTGDVWCRV